MLILQSLKGLFLSVLNAKPKGIKIKIKYWRRGPALPCPLMETLLVIPLRVPNGEGVLLPHGVGEGVSVGVLVLEGVFVEVGATVFVAGALVEVGEPTTKETAREDPNMFPFASAIRQ